MLTDRLAVALGATRGRVVGLVLRQTMMLTLVGIVLGLTAAALLTRLLASLLYGIAPLDGRTFLLAAVGFLAVAVIAAAVPSRRAARIDPMTALKAE